MIADPVARGQALAELHRRLGPRLLDELLESGVLPDDRRRDEITLRDEWECFTLYACVRGLIAAGGFNRETAAAIDALHEAALAHPPADAGRRARLAARYAEYGAIGQEGGKAGAATVTRRLGEAAARHLAGADPPGALAELAGSLHEALAEGAAEAVRQA
jgi:hypothetical protein